MNKKLLSHIEKLCLEKGATLERKNNGHFQIKGDLLVNYYPFSLKRTAYIAGTVKGFKNVDPEQAVSMAFKAPQAYSSAFKDKREKDARKRRSQRQAMLRKSDECHWCHEKLDLETSTIDHVIPLARGGLDNANNRVLACYRCNQARGDAMPELTKH